jgi:hypothetical protein
MMATMSSEKIVRPRAMRTGRLLTNSIAQSSIQETCKSLTDS